MLDTTLMKTQSLQHDIYTDTILSTCVFQFIRWIANKKTNSKIREAYGNYKSRNVRRRRHNGTHTTGVFQVTFHERHFDAIRAHGVSANVEAEHEVWVPELGAHAPHTRQLLHDQRWRD